jgi:hypothetical protein
LVFRAGLDAAELEGKDLFHWQEYRRLSTLVLEKTTLPKEHAKTNIDSRDLYLALLINDALPTDPKDRNAILTRYQEGRTGNFGDRILIAFAAYRRLADFLAVKKQCITAAKTAAFHDWYDAIDFDNLKLPRHKMANPKKPEVYNLFKYSNLIAEVIDTFVLHGWNVPITPDNKLDIEGLMNRAYQEDLIPEATYQKFDNDMAGYFESTKKHKK